MAIDKDWTSGRAGSDILADIKKMIETLHAERTYGPYEMHLPDTTLRAWGYDPNDYPELDGYPGVRVVTMRKD